MVRRCQRILAVAALFRDSNPLRNLAPSADGALAIQYEGKAAHAGL